MIFKFIRMYFSTEERLRQLWEFSKDRTSRIIDAMKEDAEAAGITQKLRDARDLLEQKTTEAKELGRSKLLEVLNSDSFETILSQLPEKTQSKIREQAESLKNALEKGVEEPNPSEIAISKSQLLTLQLNRMKLSEYGIKN